MFELPILEKAIFSGVLILYFGAVIVGMRQLSGGKDKYGQLLTALIALAVSLECLILTFLFLSIAIKQVWFGSVMVWIIFLMALLSALVARPAGRLQAAAEDIAAEVRKRAKAQM